jgi:hypothetical protein
MSEITLVTGLWDIGRGTLSEGWSRSFEHYKEKFSQLLQVENNMIIFGEPELEQFVWEHRDKSNTQFIIRNQSWFKTNEFYPLIQKIRKDPNWFNQSGWLKDSTQSQLEMYNPLVMSKIFLLHDAKLLDRFNSEYMFWIDAGLTNTVHQGYFTHDKVLEKLPKYIDRFSFVCFPYQASNEIHGFSYPKINEWAGSDVKLVPRGGFFGGPKDSIGDINTIYYSTLKDTLSKGYMGTEESVFSIMLYKNYNLINYFEIESNGLVGKFFEDLKNGKLEKKSQKPISKIDNPSNELKNNSIDKVGLYVITFNSPNQFETLVKSMLEYDSDFITKTTKFLLDNSTDLSTTPEYEKICEQYNFTHIKKDNLGICGGRQWIAEHFDETKLEYMLFFEDDMFFYPKPGETCKNGFNRYVNDLFNKSLEIIKKEDLDFLKLNFTEFFGNNSTQWSWYNVPQNFRETHWPEKPALPQLGLDPDAPNTVFTKIKIHKDVPYALGEVYYCNWPQIVSKEGNKKMFLETKWGHPFEQTWMSHMYQETIKGNLSSGLLLMTPTEHNRYEFYSAELRKES